MFLNAGALHMLLAVGRNTLLPRLTGARLASALLLGVPLVSIAGATGAAAGFAASEWLLFGLAWRACRQAGIEMPFAHRSHRNGPAPAAEGLHVR